MSLSSMMRMYILLSGGDWVPETTQGGNKIQIPWLFSLGLMRELVNRWSTYLQGEMFKVGSRHLYVTTSWVGAHIKKWSNIKYWDLHNLLFGIYFNKCDTILLQISSCVFIVLYWSVARWSNINLAPGVGRHSPGLAQHHCWASTSRGGWNVHPPAHLGVPSSSEYFQGEGKVRNEWSSLGALWGRERKWSERVPDWWISTLLDPILYFYNTEHWDSSLLPK